MAVASVNDGAPIPRQWAAPIVAYGAFALTCITLLHQTVFEMVNMWAGSSSWLHGYFVSPLALWMIYSRRHHAPPPAAAFGAIGFVLGAALLWLFGNAAGAALIEQLAFVSMLIAGAAAIFGLAVIRAFALPLGFLFFMIPFGEVFIPALQTVTAASVVSLLKLTGMTITIDGYLIETPGGAFNIAAACAGLNFLLVAIMASAYISYAWFKRWGKRLAFIALAVVAAIATNIARVFLIILLAGVTPDEWRIASDHFAFGLALYTAMIAVLLAIGLHLADHTRRNGV